jgi:hypothetical protein
VLGRPDGLAAGAEQLTEPHVAVREVGEIVEQAVGHAVGFIELAGVKQIEDAVGQPVQALALSSIAGRQAGPGGRMGSGRASRRCCSGEAAAAAASSVARQQCLYFLPLPQGQGWFRPTSAMESRCRC